MSNQADNKSHPRSTEPSGISKLVVGALAIIIVGILGFLGGIQYQKGKQQTPIAGAQDGVSGNQEGGFGGFQGGPNGAQGMRGVFGEVTAVSNTSISVQDARNDSTSTLEITGDTKVTNNGQSASVSDIKVGDNVIIQTNSSNSKQADQIILNPQMPSPGGNTPTTTN